MLKWVLMSRHRHCMLYCTFVVSTRVMTVIYVCLKPFHSIIHHTGCLPLGLGMYSPACSPLTAAPIARGALKALRSEEVCTSSSAPSDPARTGPHMDALAHYMEALAHYMRAQRQTGPFGWCTERRTVRAVLSGNTCWTDCLLFWIIGHR